MGQSSFLQVACMVLTVFPLRKTTDTGDVRQNFAALQLHVARVTVYNLYNSSAHMPDFVKNNQLNILKF